MEAARCAQTQAEQRVQLGLKLFKAAEAHTVNYQNMVEQVRLKQQQLREKLEHDVARSLHTYDQWIGEIDDGVTEVLKALEHRIDKLQSDWCGTQQRIEQMMTRSESLLDQQPFVGQPEVVSHPEVTISVAPPPDPNKPKNDGMTFPATPTSKAHHAGKAAASGEDEPGHPKPICGELLRRLLDEPES
jgi:hypothetical protein